MLTVNPPLPPTAYVRSAKALPFPLREPGCTLWRRARRGLYEAVRAAGLGHGDAVLMPAWHHGSEVESMVRAGVQPRFYSIGPHLEPDPAELEAALGPEVRALHLVHFLGIPVDAARWRAWCDRHGLLLIEDAAQGWLATDGGGPVGRHGDIAIFSLYKAFGVPDGGAVVVRDPAATILRPGGSGTERDIGVRGTARAHAWWLMSRLGLASSVGRRLMTSRPYDPAADFRLDAPRRASRATAWLLPRVVDLGAPARRRQHYRHLAEALGRWVPPPFRVLPPGASPFALPIAVEDRQVAAAQVRERGVRPVALWSVPHPTLPAHEFPAAARWRQSLLALPVHQELSADDLERIVAAVHGAAPRPAFASTEWPASGEAAAGRPSYRPILGVPEIEVIEG